MELQADQDTIVKAIKLISSTLEENDVPRLEGAIAMKSILNSLAEQGFDLRSEPAQ